MYKLGYCLFKTHSVEAYLVFFFFFNQFNVLQINVHHIKFIIVNVPSNWMDILNLKFITTF